MEPPGLDPPGHLVDHDQGRQKNLEHHDRVAQVLVPHGHRPSAKHYLLPPLYWATARRNSFLLGVLIFRGIPFKMTQSPSTLSTYFKLTR